MGGRRIVCALSRPWRLEGKVPYPVGYPLVDRLVENVPVNGVRYLTFEPPRPTQRTDNPSTNTGRDRPQQTCCGPKNYCRETTVPRFVTSLSDKRQTNR